MGGPVSGMVFNIERYAVDDGPGIRTLVFLKGCPLRCEWCANPESQVAGIQVMYHQNKCRGCGRCLDSCPEHAIRTDEEFGLVTDADRCTGCGTCVDACYYGARERIGRAMTVDEVMGVIEKDRMFYEVSGGGVTVSGGEPFFQHEFAGELLKRCKAAGLNTAIETSGFAPWKAIEPALPFLDLVFYDVKHTDPEAHREYTGVSNELILANLQKLARARPAVIIRVPFIPNRNDAPEVQREIYKLAGGFDNVVRVEVLPYHRLGIGKYRGLGRRYKLDAVTPVRKDELGYLAELGRECGVTVQIGAS